MADGAGGSLIDVGGQGLADAGLAGLVIGVVAVVVLGLVILLVWPLVLLLAELVVALAFIVVRLVRGRWLVVAEADVGRMVWEVRGTREAKKLTGEVARAIATGAPLPFGYALG